MGFVKQDREVYTTEGKPTFAVQFRDENGDWVDTGYEFRSSNAAIQHLEGKSATAYSYRVVERKILRELNA